MAYGVNPLLPRIVFPLQRVATTATATFEATVLEVDTVLMALAGWLLLGSSGAQLVSLLVDTGGKDGSRAGTYERR